MPESHESRGERIGDRYVIRERRKFNHGPNNELYLIDDHQILNVSREHFQIEKNSEGFRIVDRNSACGTIVSDGSIGGGDEGGSHPLQDGNVIIVGRSNSPFVFQFCIETVD